MFGIGYLGTDVGSPPAGARTNRSIPVPLGRNMNPAATNGDNAIWVAWHSGPFLCSFDFLRYLHSRYQPDNNRTGLKD